MADYSTLKNAITAVIRTNYNEEITGQILQDVLIGMVNALGSGYLLMGVATPGTSPGTPDANVAYLTATAGSYANFDDIVVNDEIALLVWDGSWHKQTLANAFTDTEKTKLAGIEEGAQVNPPIDIELNPDSHNAVENAVIASAVRAIYDTIYDIRDTKADKNGEAPEMVVGTAQGLRSKVIAEMFTNRITGKGIVGSGAAMMTALRGRTLKWNQLVKNGNFVSTANWSGDSSTTRTVSNNVMEVVRVDNSSTYLRQDLGIKAVVGHKYYVHIEHNFSSADSFGRTLRFYLFSDLNGNNSMSQDDSSYVSYVGIGAWAKYSNVLEAYHSYSGSTYIFLPIPIIPGGLTDNSFKFRNIFIVDLTEMFGSGNEPSTASAFEALYNAAYYAQNTGTLLPFKGTGLKTVGFNIWDEQWEQGTINNDGTNASSSARIRSKNYIPVFPGVTYYYKITQSGFNASDAAFYDINKQFISFTTAFHLNSAFVIPANAYYVRFSPSSQYGNTYKNDICINRSDANRNGQYEPYHTETHLWPFTTETANNGEDVPFADGMNGYGGVYDTLIVENGWAKGGTKRIGIRAYQSGDESDASVITDGVNTAYVLSTPVEYIFDNPFPVIYSEDRDGTETVLPVGVDANGVPNTAPMDATIEYPINADQLISADSMRSYLEARKTAGEISAYTMVWNQTTQQYDFTITT